MSEIGFGCEPLGGTDWGDVDEDAIHRAIRGALELGVRYFDTAPVYGLGLSEERLGRFLGAHRNQVCIGTKAGMEALPASGAGRAQVRINCSRDALFESVHGSLRRLRLDAIPLLFIHYPDPAVPLEDLMETLQSLKREGKVREVGFSNFGVSLLSEIAKVQGIDAVQFEYSLLNRECEKASLAFAKQHQIPTFAYGVLARGLLSGKFADGKAAFPATDRRNRLEAFSGEQFTRNVSLANQLRPFAAKYSTSVSAVAIRWLQEYSGVSTTIVGIKNEKQFLENWETHRIDFQQEDLEAINAIFS